MAQEYKEKLELFFEKNRQQMIEDICRLVKIPSVGADPLPGKPYGETAAKALEEALKMAEKKGFAVKDYDHYVGAVDFCEEPTQLAILAHLDVVPEGTGWQVTKPYEPVMIENRLYGRGTSDDKGPAIAALYAMMAVKELGITLHKNVRLLLGTDEERGSSDLKHYFSIEKAPPMSFSPDAWYPVINIEKGGLHSTFHAEWAEETALPRLISLESGTTGNIVPREGTALLEGLEKSLVAEHCKAFAEKSGVLFTITEENGKLRIDALGEGAHASMPEKGKNAAQALAELIAGLPLADSASFRALKNFAALFPYGDYYGKSIGVAQKDDVSGVLTLNIGIFKMDLTSISGKIDSRTPICANEQNMSKVVEAKLAKCGIHLDTTAMNPPHHTDADSPLVKTLLQIYEEYTGRKGECIAIGGGTYVHHIEGGVAFGCGFPEEDNHEHGADEFVNIDQLLLSAKMFAEAIIKLCA